MATLKGQRSRREREQANSAVPMAIFHCDMCASGFRMGPHVYEGRFLSAYSLTVCGSCFEGNWDGWNPRWEPKLKAHLARLGIPLPPRNAAGLYPRGA